MGIERAGRDHHQAQRVADQVDQRLVGHQARIFGEDGGAGRILDMGFERDGTFHAQRLHEARDKEDAVEKILFLIFGTLEHLAKAAAQRLQVRARIADDQRADGCATDDDHFMRQGVENRANVAAGEDEAAKHHGEQHDQADDCEHVYP